MPPTIGKTPMPHSVMHWHLETRKLCFDVVTRFIEISCNVLF